MNDGALVKLETAQRALSECRTVMEAKEISDAAEAVRIYLERTNASVATVNRATEIRLLAERQMGEFVAEMPKNAGANGSVVSGSRRKPVKDETPTLAEVGITKKQSHVAQKLAAIPKEEFQERIAVTKASGKRLSTAAVLRSDSAAYTQSLSPQARAAGEEAERDTPNLWRLKSLWRKSAKRDRSAFLAWVRIQP